MSSTMSLVDLGKKLLESARLGESEDVTLLMSNGAPFTTDWLGASPLHLAAQNGHIETVKILIRAGISRDARTKLDRTSLHLAAQEGHLEIVDFLLKSGADIEAKDMLKMTPLHWAVERGHLQAVQILLRNNAGLDLKNKFDKAPSDIASDNNYTDIYELLQNQLALKGNQSGKSNSDHHVDPTSIPSSDSTETVTTSHILEVNKNAKSYSNYLKSSPNSKKTLASHSKFSKNTSKPDFMGIKLIQKDSFGNDSSEIQTSTSVLATLAALAEATASKAGNTTEASNWLEANGITMLPVENSTVVASALEGGQSLALTEAGKLALNWTKSQPNGNADCGSGDESLTLHHDVSNASQKVITIVTTDQSQIPSIVNSATESGHIYLMDADGSEALNLHEHSQTNGPPAKTPKVEKDQQKNHQSKDEISEREKLQKELEEARRVAEEYKAQLQQKQHEAETYKKQLDEISSLK